MGPQQFVVGFVKTFLYIVLRAVSSDVLKLQMNMGEPFQHVRCHCTGIATLTVVNAQHGSGNVTISVSPIRITRANLNAGSRGQVGDAKKFLFKCDDVNMLEHVAITSFKSCAAQDVIQLEYIPQNVQGSLKSANALRCVHTQRRDRH